MRSYLFAALMVWLCAVSAFAETVATLPVQLNGIYQISTLAELRWVSENPSSWGREFELTADIDAAETAVWNNATGFTPIGLYDATSAFTGVFKNKGNFVISNLSINRPDSYSLGLFSRIVEAELIGLRMENISILGKGISGGLVASALRSKISGCYSTGGISISTYTAGGLVGQAESSLILNSYSSCSVSGDAVVGGLLGRDDGCFIARNYSTGTVVGNQTRGGLVGWATSRINMDDNFFDTQTSGVSSGKGIGSHSSQRGAAGKTTLEMQDQVTFENAGWDLAYTWVLNANSYPMLNDYIGVKAVMPSLLNGKYQISNLAELRWLTENSSHWDKSYILIADIDAAETVSWSGGRGALPIGNRINNVNTAFTGSFENEAGYKIFNWHIFRPLQLHIGFFGFAEGAQICSLHLENLSIVGAEYVGGIGGNFERNSIGESCKISRSSVTGKVSGNDSVGGLAGAAISTLFVSSYSRASVNGEDKVGGLIGAGSGGVFFCYVAGEVKGTGANKGAIAGSGRYMRFYGNFFDPVATKISSYKGVGDEDYIYGIEARSKENMQTPSPYLSRGWNFSLVWSMKPDEYPEYTGYQSSAVAEEPALVNGKYHISNLNELRWLSETRSAWQNDFLLVADIDASPTAVWYGGIGFSCIGDDSDPFEGSFKATGPYSIKGLTINRPNQEYVGMFGYAKRSHFYNIRLEDVSIIGGAYTGGLVGFSTRIGLASETGNPHLEYCSVTGIIKEVSRDKDGYVGGLCGAHRGYGSENRAVFENCYFSGTVISEGSPAGGLAGFVFGSNIDQCYSEGEIISTALSGAGGQTVGGLIGEISESKLKNSYSLASVVSSHSHTGGLLGSVEDTPAIINCFSAGLVTTSVNRSEYTAGFAGRVQGGTSGWAGNFFDTETSGYSANEGVGDYYRFSQVTEVRGRNTSEMKMGMTFTAQNWDLESIWYMVGEGAYPVHLTSQLASTNYGAWAMNFQLVGSDFNPFASPANDGVGNLLKYALGAPPTMVSNIKAGSIAHTEGQVEFSTSFKRYQNRRDINIYLEYTSDLTNPWLVIASCLGGETVTVENGASLPGVTTGSDPEIVNVKHIGVSERGFYRWRVEYR